MALSPRRDPGLPHSPDPRGSRRRLLWPLLGAVTLAAGAGGGLWWADRQLRRSYGQARTALERQLGGLLGHPLRLGAYQGIGWGGLELGPTRLGPGPLDGSTAELAGLNVSLDPLASLWQRQPVLHIGLRDARLTLRRNARGQYWVLGQPSAGTPPRLDLRFRLMGNARVRVEPAGVEASVGGRLRLQPALRRLELRARLAPGSGGRLDVAVQGGWNPAQWQVDLQGSRLPLEPLQRLAQLPGRLSGESGGSLRLELQGDRRRCSGSWQVPRLLWAVAPSRPSPCQPAARQRGVCTAS